MNTFLRQLKEHVKKISRRKKNDYFYSLCRHRCNVLDVGVFPETLQGNRNISTNDFLKGFRFPSRCYTGLSIDPLDGMDDLYPGKKFVHYDGGTFPFDNKSFEWSYSNAVIEHVGDHEAQVGFLKEMMRVSHNVFFTTPNKYFPVDAHTMVFFLHWNERLFWRWRLSHHKWVPKESLNLLSYHDITQVLHDAKARNYRIIRNRFLGMTMTFTIVITAPVKVHVPGVGRNQKSSEEVLVEA
jgi:hypothetical protein